MKKILLSIFLSSSLAYAGKIEKVMHCISKDSSLDPIQHELIVSGDNSTHAYTYSFVKDRYRNHSFLPDPHELMYESHGDINQRLAYDMPTYIFDNDHIHIVPLFGEDRQYKDETKNFSFTFRAGECELFPLHVTTPTPLDGVYDMQITINGKVFNDVMEIHGKKSPLGITGFTQFQDVVGSITVPGIFISNLTGRLQYVAWMEEYYLNIAIIANENGQSYKVQYDITIDRSTSAKFRQGEKNISLKGTATLENGEKLGDFVATRRQ